MVSRWSEVYTRVTVPRVRPLPIVGRTGPRRFGVAIRTKITSWDSRLDVLGWIVDTDELSVTMPPANMQKLRRLMAEWPSSCKWP